MVDHVRDLQADFRAIYHMSWTEALELPAPEFFGLAYRAGVYPGTIRSRIEQADSRERRNFRPGTRKVAAEREAIESDSLMRGLVDFG